MMNMLIPGNLTTGRKQNDDSNVSADYIAGTWHRSHVDALPPAIRNIKHIILNVRYRSDRNNPSSCGVYVNEGKLLRKVRFSKAEKLEKEKEVKWLEKEGEQILCILRKTIRRATRGIWRVEPSNQYR